MKRWLILVGAIAGMGLIALVGFLWLQRNPVPTEIKQQVDFGIFYPSPIPIGFSADNTSFKYDKTAKILIYVIKKGDNKITVTQQSTPDQFNDIPQYFDKLAEKLNQYTGFDTTAGKVALTRPKELGGGQTALMNSKGTLLFARPEKDLSDSDWRRLFNSLEISK